MVWIDGTLDVTCDLAFFAKLALIVGHTCWRNDTQLLDKLFAISRIMMEVEVGDISRRQRLVTPTEILIILDITKSECNNLFIIHWTEKKLILKSWFASSSTASSTKQANLTWLPLEIMHCGHTWPYYRWPWESLTWLLYTVICSYDVTGADFENALYTFGQSEKR